MSLNIKFLSIIALAFTLSSCFQKIGELRNLESETLENKNWMEILDSLSKKKPQFFYAKMNSEFKSNTSNKKFKTSLRMVEDSAMNVLITYATAPVFNSIITPDSVLLVNKLDKCYQNESVEMIKSLVGVDFSYSNLEEIFLGLPIAFDSTRTYTVFSDEGFILVSNLTKKQWKKKDKLEPSETKGNLSYTYIINPINTNLVGMHIYSPLEGAIINLRIDERTEIESYQIPGQIFLDIQLPKNAISIQLHYNKIEVNQPQEFIFKIPEDYEKCN
jgi:hypothetical protein